MRKLSKLAAIVLVLALSLSLLAGCGQAAPSEKTAFFTYSVEKAEKVDSFEGIKPSEGNKLLAVTVSVKNTFGDDIPMWDSDFQLQWGAGDEDFANPMEASSDKQLPEEYTIKDNATRTGVLLFDIPADLTDFTLVYVEYFQDGTEGEFHELAFEAK